MINIEKLKRHIIDLAIKGKISERQSSDGDASDLISSIRQKKEELIRDGLLKREKALAPIEESEIPFEIPSNWVWIRLGDYSQKVTDQVASGSFKDLRENVVSLKEPDYALMVKTADFANNFTENLTYTNKRGYDFLSNSNLFGGELILSNIGSVGKVFIVPHLDMRMTLAPNTVMIRLVDDSLLMYLYYFFLSNQGFKELDDISTGTAVKKFNKGDLKTILVPIPPKEEQLKIVNKLDVVFEELDKIDFNQNKIVFLKQKLQSLVLDLAIKGKLVEQKETEGNAETLIKTIETKKAELIKNKTIKPSKKSSPIKDEEIPFFIPSSWKWIRLADICTKIVDGDHNPPSGVDYKTDFLMISAINVNDDKICEFNRVRYLDEDTFRIENERTKLQEGDILLTIVGTMGRSCIYDGTLNLAFQRSVSVITTLVDNKYLKIVFDSPYIQHFMEFNSTGTAQKGFYLNQVASLLIPVPPFAEQNRIVERVDEILSVCRKIV